MDSILLILPLVIGWVLDYCFGDPASLPHPIVGFGKCVSFMELKLNKGTSRRIKGAIAAILLVMVTFLAGFALLRILAPFELLSIFVEGVLIFFCLSGTTLIKEVRMVFKMADRSLAEGRKQVARIVGRDTSELSDQEVRTAALETLAENLSDGVVAPLFWYALLGLPGMLAYKMVNTLDSMIGYRNERYKDFGCFAARMDDVANFVPARLTAWLMITVCRRWNLAPFVWKYGRCHASPNSGYPEAALAAILDCRFGGTHKYFGQDVYKPYIGENQRDLSSEDMEKATVVNRRVEFAMMLITMFWILLTR